MSLKEVSQGEESPTADNTPHVDQLATRKSRRSKRPGRHRTNWYLLTVAVVLFLGWAFYTFAWPPIHQSIRFYLQPNRAKFEQGLESPVRELYQTCEYLAVIWFFYLGASIGSFFNVLAGRLPEGRGVVFGGSKCPYCQTRLSFRDNIPILGWLACQGRCSTCKLPIAPRYILVEVLVGALFVLIAARELFSGGANLPNFNVLTYAGIIWTVFYPKWYLIGAFVFHAMFFASLVMLAMADLEKSKFPWRAVGVFGICFSVAKILHLPLSYVQWFALLPIAPPTLGGVAHVAVTLVVGIGIGWLFGVATARLLPFYVHEKSRTHYQQAFVLVGIVLGWQAVLVTGLGVLVFSWMGSVLSSLSFKYPSQLFFGILVSTILVHHVYWRQIDSIIKRLVV